jgi:hypothetical protein
MGGFYFSSRNENHDASLNVFEKKGMPIQHRVQINEYTFVTFGKIIFQEENFIQFNDGGFIAAVGTFIFNNRIGVDALDEFYSEFCRSGSINSHLQERIFGNYCVIIYTDGHFNFVNDPAGFYHVFICDSDGITISSSFLAVLESLTQIDISTQEVYEYLATGAFYGGKTLCRQIWMLNGRQQVVIDSQKAYRVIPNYQNFDIYKKDGKNLKATTEGILSELRAYFSMIKNNFDGEIIADISGGHDTRLLTCLLKDKKIDHHSRVIQYPDNQPDTDVAQQITAGEKIPLLISASQDIVDLIKDRDLLQEKISHAYYICDGIGTELFPLGVWLNQYLQDTTKGFRLAITGTGGENFRAYGNWFRKEPVSLQKFVHEQFNAGFLNQEYQEGYCQNLVGKIKTHLGIQRDFLLPHESEILYQTFRVRYWCGRAASVYNQFTYSLAPFTEDRISKLGIKAPSKLKEKSKLQIKMMKELDLSLIKYPTDKGLSFYEIDSTRYCLRRELFMTTRRFLDLLGLGKYLRLLKLKYLSANNTSLSIDYDLFKGIFGERDLLAHQFWMDSWPNELMLSRFYSLEYLIRHTGIS